MLSRVFTVLRSLPGQLLGTPNIGRRLRGFDAEHAVVTAIRRESLRSGSVTGRVTGSIARFAVRTPHECVCLAG